MAAAGGALAGLRIVALEQAVAAPLCTRHLADLGADVIKVESPRGDFARQYDSVVMGASAYFVWLNRGKRSIALDLTEDADRHVMDRLLGAADVFVHNLGPGAIERLGYGWDSLSTRWSRLISVGISGFGTSGPYRQRKSFDLLVQAESGLMSVTGTEAHPVKVGVSIADISAGMYALVATLAALRQRDADASGRQVEIAMLDCLAEWMMVPALHARHTGTAPKASGARHGLIVPYGPYRCLDGTVTLAVQNDDQWIRLCRQVLQRPDVAIDQRFFSNELRVANRDELESLIEDGFRSRTRRDLEGALERADIPFANMNGVGDLLIHPQLAARGRWSDVETLGGTASLVRAPFDQDLDGRRTRVPELDEHGAEIRRELGIA